MGGTGRGCIDTSHGSVPCSERAPERANRGLPGHRGGQYYRAKWPVLDILEEPTDGARKWRGDDREGSSPPPSSCFPSAFLIPSRNALGLGKECLKRIRPPSLLLGITGCRDAGGKRIWNWDVAEMINEAMLPGLFVT